MHPSREPALTLIVLWGSVILLWGSVGRLLGYENPAIESWGYESAKTLLASTLLGAWILTRPKRLLSRALWIGAILTALFAIMGAGQISLYGSFYLPQGVFFPLLIILAGLLSYEIPASEIKKITRSLSIFLGILLLYSLVQIAGFDPILSRVESTDWSRWRAFSSLWNPNTLGMLTLICLPIVWPLKQQKSALKTVFLSFLPALIAATLTMLSWSVSCIALMVVYLLWRALQRFPQLIIPLILVSLLGAFLAGSLLPRDKILSWNTRLVIAGDIVRAYRESPLRSQLFGHGAGSLQSLFTQERSARLNEYIPAHRPIDRAHNLILDILWQYGIFGVMLAIFLIVKGFQKTDTVGKSALVLFLLASLIHTPLLVHYLVMIWVVVKQNRLVLIAESEK